MGVNVSPSVADVGTSATPSVADVGTSATSSVADVGTSATPSVADVGTSATSPIAVKKMSDTEDQVSARNWVKAMYKANPNWGALKIEPINRKSGEDDTRYYLGKNGSVISVRSGNKNRKYTAFDWIATEEKIRGIWSDAESNSLDETSTMQLEDPLYRYYLVKKWLHGKRNNPSPVEDTSERSRQRLDDSVEYDNETSTSSDQSDSKLKLFWLIKKNINLLESNGMRKKILPIRNGGTKSTAIDQDGYVWIDGNSISVFGKASGHVKPAVTKKINWHATLQSFISMTKDRGLDLSFVGSKDAEMEPKEFIPGVGEAQHGVLSGPDDDMDESLTNADNDAKKIMLDYYTKIQADGIKIAFRLSPILETKDGNKPHTTYYFGQPSPTKEFNFKNWQHKSVSGEALKTLNKNIRWMDTFNALMHGLEEENKYVNDNYGQTVKNNLDLNLQALNRAIIGNTKSSKHSLRIKSPDATNTEFQDGPLKKFHDESEEAFQKYGEAQKLYQAAKQSVKGTNSKAARSALKAAESAMKAKKVIFQAKSKRYSDAKRNRGTKLVGRGLIGRGVAPLEGVVRRGRTYNLNEIQGLATPSAYTYRQLGSKYIRIPDLDAKTLVIVQPNRRKCGPKCKISDSLQAMIRTLAFKQHIDQPAYDNLSIDDRKLFKEILAITHLQYNFHDRLEDPMDSLRAEYDKLKGELELGNDNPSIIKQLKSLSVDMYSNRLISDSEFKDIIVRLI